MPVVTGIAAVTAAIALATAYSQEEGDLMSFSSKFLRAVAVRDTACVKGLDERFLAPLGLCLDANAVFLHTAEMALQEQKQWKVTYNSAKWIMGKFDKEMLARSADLDAQTALVLNLPDYQSSPQDLEVAQAHNVPGMVGVDEVPERHKLTAQSQSSVTTQSLLEITAKDLYAKNGFPYESERPGRAATIEFFREKFPGGQDVTWDDKLNCIKAADVDDADIRRAVTVLEILALGDPTMSYYDRARQNSQLIGQRMPTLVGAVTYENVVEKNVSVSGGGVTLEWLHQVQKNTADILTGNYSVAPSVAHAIPLSDFAAILDSAHAAQNLREARFRISEFITTMIKKTLGQTVVTLYEFKFEDTLSSSGDVSLAVKLATISVSVGLRATPEDFA